MFNERIASVKKYPADLIHEDTKGSDLFNPSFAFVKQICDSMILFFVNVIPTAVRKQYHNYKKITLFSLFLFCIYLENSMKHLSY